MTPPLVMVAREFLESTAAQLTHYGLSVLVESVREGDYVVVFRNNHFTMCHKREVRVGGAVCVCVCQCETKLSGDSIGTSLLTAVCIPTYVCPCLCCVWLSGLPSVDTCHFEV